MMDLPLRMWNSTFMISGIWRTPRRSTNIRSAAEYPLEGSGQLSQMDEIGLYYYVVRIYDPYLNHFTQADTIVPQPGMSVAYDRFAHVQWNPIRYNEPSEHVDNDFRCFTRKKLGF